MHILPVEGREMPASLPFPHEWPILGSAVSGGSFTDFLESAMEKYGGKFCLYLEPRRCRFSLPCSDGQGEDLREGDPILNERKGKYTEILCCNWIYLPEAPAVILYDDIRSLRRKYQLAEAAGVPWLMVREEILQKIKTP